MNTLHRICFAAAAIAAWPLAADDAPVERRNFVSCPVVRDTQSVPCWLAEYDGELYFLTLQTDVSSPVTPPWLGHRVLVEGTIARDRPRICGGVVLEPVVLSVLPELDAACNTPVLPAEARYNLTFEPPRPPGPSAGRLAFAGDAPPAAPPEPPREFLLRYDFDGLVVFRHAGQLTAILDAARARKSRAIAITGHRGSVLLSNGTTLTEQPAVARRRAEQVATLLRGAGLTDVEYDIQWQDDPGVADGRDDASLRRVMVALTP
ncbi:MAG TPA: hypothetical protein VM692_00500 [Gammaproteobacteria bacterium]|nr:hypothetical protein [Gammaproteobacteria bacterium]